MTGALLMSTTLPSIVGMYVVAETTKVLFDKKTGKKKTVKVKKRFKIYKGKRGGQYIMKKGRRVYI